MPRIITIEQPIGGWISHPEGMSGTSVGAGSEGREDQYTESAIIDPFRFEKRGHIAPGEVFTALTDAGSRVNELPLSATVADNGEVFAVLKNARVVQFGVADDTIDGTYVIGTDVVTGYNSDIISFTDGTDVTWIAWSYEYNGSGADIARVKSDGTSQDDDWFSTLTSSGLLTKGVPLKMQIGADGILYCTNDQYVASHDPATNTGNTQALNLGTGWVAQDLSTYQNLLAILAYKSTTYLTGFSQSSSRLYLWDGFSPDPNFIYEIPDYYATALFNDNGKLFIWSKGRTNATRVHVFTGNAVVPIFTHGAIGNPPRARSVWSYKGNVVWGYGSADYEIGALTDLGDRYAFHEIMHPHTDTTSLADIGLVKDITSNGLYVGNKVSTTNRILKINHSTYYPNADWRSRFIPLPYEATITKIRVFLSQFGSGASFRISLMENYDSISIGGASDLLNKTVAQATWGSVDEVSIPTYIPRLSGFYINVRFNHSSSTDTAAIIRKIEIHYEPTNAV